jgi:hypothetical protein
MDDDNISQCANTIWNKHNIHPPKWRLKGGWQENMCSLTHMKLDILDNGHKNISNNIMGCNAFSSSVYKLTTNATIQVKSCRMREPNMEHGAQCTMQDVWKGIDYLRDLNRNHIHKWTSKPALCFASCPCVGFLQLL